MSKFYIVPKKEIKGVLPRNKRINEPTTLENLNKNDIIRCLQHGDVYMDVDNEWVHITSYQDTLKEKNIREDRNIITQQPYDMAGRIVNANKRTTKLNRPKPNNIFVTKKSIAQVAVTSVPEKVDVDKILEEFDKNEEKNLSLDNYQIPTVNELEKDIDNNTPENSEQDKYDQNKNHNNRNNNRHNNQKRR